MRGASACHGLGRAIGALALFALLAPGAGAFEAFDGRLQVHGFFESQLRSISADFGEDWDVTQWYNILNIELELDIVEDGHKGLDLLSAYVRWEGRYDCIYSRGCGMFRSMNAFGDRSKSLPRRLSNATARTSSGQLIVADEGRLSGANTDPVPLSLVDGFKTLADTDAQTFWNIPNNTIDPSNPTLERGDPCNPAINGPNCVATGSVVDGQSIFMPRPFDFVFENFESWRFTQINAKGGRSNGNPIRILGPWLPKNKDIHTLAALADRVNPFDSSRENRVLFKSSDLKQEIWETDPIGAPGGGSRLFLPIPIIDEGNPGIGTVEGRGLYLPSLPIQRTLANKHLDTLPVNFTENQRAFNRGDSQRQTKELKEAYLDIETFDSRLWLRVGKQNIVWGKTELFRTTDQFNPVDLALASLPSLEEQRIALWAVRGVWSFYEIGPLQDLRLELAFNFDEYQNNDLGACGEPYTVDLVCGATFGAFAHSVTGVGVAGVVFPQAPWQSLKGWEIGARLEWRWDRFSFAISDFWGYADLPTINRIGTYERNVDPNTGRPRRYGARGPCTTQDPITQRVNYGDPLLGSTDPDCLRPGPTDRRVLVPENTPDNVRDCDAYGADSDMCTRVPNPDYNPGRAQRYVVDPTDGKLKLNTLDQTTGLPTVPEVVVDGVTVSNQAFVSRNALEEHHSNTQIFTWICSNTIGFNDVDPQSCGISIFGSGNIAAAGLSLSKIIGALLGGSPDLNALLTLVNPPDPDAFLPFGLPIVLLSQDYGDQESYGCVDLTGDSTGQSHLCGGGSGDGQFNPSGIDGGNFLAQRLSPEQEALLGCGPFWGTNCDFSGIDLLNAEASAVFQSFAGFEGSVEAVEQLAAKVRKAGIDPALMGGLAEFRADGYRSVIERYNADYPDNPYNGPLGAVPGNLDFAVARIGGPICTTQDFGGAPGQLLPGCNNRWLDLERTVQNPRWDASNSNPFASRAGVDGNPDPLGVAVEGVLTFPGNVLTGPGAFNRSEYQLVAAPAGPENRGAGHPLTGMPFANELAGVSYNFQSIVIAFSNKFSDGLNSVEVFCGETAPDSPRCAQTGDSRERRLENLFGYAYTGTGDPQYKFGPDFRLPNGEKDPDYPDGIPYIKDGETEPVPDRYLQAQHCGFINPQYCDNVQSLFRVAGMKRPVARAGGNERYGRRSFQWHSGGEVLLDFDKRNVLGFSVDAAEDVTKSNWSAEFTWIPDVAFTDSNSFSNISRADTYNLTISVDRPTFINFLNPNRTFFFNSQVFFQYVGGYNKGFTSNGPWNVLATFTVQSGYFQDRLLPSFTFVYDVQSTSGAFLPQIAYRFSENFSATIGVLAFWGREQLVDMPINEIAPAGARNGPNAFKDSAENGLSLVRNRDEVFLRLRYTF